MIPIAMSMRAAAPDSFLWEIGARDDSDAEFALAPGGFGQFKTDGFFVVGESDARRDWPYVHPGPGDSWAGGTQHTFIILFGVKSVPGAGECRLEFALLDTHNQGPPKLRVQVNGQAFDRELPPGAGDGTVRGESAPAKAHQFNLPFPADLLKAGDNEVRITTLTGSWMIYDWIGLATPPGVEPARVQARTLVDVVTPIRALLEKEGHAYQPVRTTLRHFGDNAQAVLRLQDAQPMTVQLNAGLQTVEMLAPAVTQESRRTVTVEVNGQVTATRDVTLKPVRKLKVYVLPHSHTDIGYTEIQTAIEKKQVNNLLEGMAAARRTAAYPDGARFVWNVEVAWAADLYLRRLDAPQRQAFLQAVKEGRVAMNGMYLNELTGLCRPEELVQLFRFATDLAARTGVPIDSAMISDVPGYTWGTVTALTQAGIKYLSAAPNYFDRIGTILREWENKPFYWVGPDGQSKVLVWIPFWGYALSHRYGQMSPQLVNDFCDGLEKRGYPYDIAYVRWSGHGDNATPDPAICEFVKDWNSRYVWPKFIIAGTSEAFRALEDRYGDKLPRVRGDWTPYWEDGAGSSALQTALNRASSDRLVQAETLFAMLQPSAFPSATFVEAWKNVLLYSEHTWGADCSISQPESQKTREQWEIKKSYAEQADKLSRELLEKAMETGPDDGSSSVDVLNTLSWSRTELALIPAAIPSVGERVLDDRDKAVPSQRLSSGQLVFLARNVPPFAARRFRIAAGEPNVEARVRAGETVLDNGLVRVRVDGKTGGIVELTAKGLPGNLADTRGGEAINDYLYLPGDDLKDLQRSGPVTIHPGEKGPLVCSLLVESGAPGCKTLRRELRLAAGFDFVEIIDLVDKARLQAKSYHAKEGKESVNFAFPFNVPDGDLLLDIPLGVIRPEIDQMPSACKNWFTVGRWADVSNRTRGVTWVTLDAPLVEVGGLTATLLNSQTNPDIWRNKVERTQKIYCWAMNNHWGTNYRAYQEGPTVFRFIIRPHGKPDPAENSRFATGLSQPLVVRNARKGTSLTPLFRVAPDDVLVTALKPSDDGKAWVIRLFGASGKSRSATLKWGEPRPTTVSLSDTSEKSGPKAAGRVSVPGYGLVTLRAEFE